MVPSGICTSSHSPSVGEDDVAVVPDFLAGRDGDLLAGERDALHEFVDAAAQLLPRLVVAHPGEADGVDPGEGECEYEPGSKFFSVEKFEISFSIINK